MDDSIAFLFFSVIVPWQLQIYFRHRKTEGEHGHQQR